jgi:hypothetical protein
VTQKVGYHIGGALEHSKSEYRFSAPAKQRAKQTAHFPHSGGSFWPGKHTEPALPAKPVRLLSRMAMDS